MMRLAALFALALAAAPAAATGPQSERPQQGRIRYSELRDLSDAALVERMFGQLAAFPIVGHRDLEDRLAFRRARLWFYSPARLTDRAGVCASDRIIVGFAGDVGSEPDPVMRIAGVDLQTYYIVENAAEAERITGRTERSDNVRRVACGALEPWRGGVPADSTYQLMKARALVETAGTAAREGRAVAPLDCSEMRFSAREPAGEAGCLAELGHLRAVTIGWVSACSSYRDAPGGCIRVMGASSWVEFDLSERQQPIRIVMSSFPDETMVN